MKTGEYPLETACGGVYLGSHHPFPQQNGTQLFFVGYPHSYGPLPVKSHFEPHLWNANPIHEHL